ncbi:hypothetical protein A5791_12935 [Mycobacterium sp. 852002-51163_SCH5372311]|uniref:DUF4190 domain-containing protein n=1 Tax=Mycobacterium sp. 852002-51163_SCH5372311 TaxID=1834097 RepID=UPI0007FCC5C8|nr:DUF4190 domain-containing protein [Mycobacterium sp. 852002-51163_SCH5372311]OBF93285.1 hypothetical protein A5791_12935 [Mycobacterium sp. 852002-51163_SCH5372311]
MSQPGPPQDKLAVVSVILGVVALITSWVLIGMLFGVAAIVTGWMGRSRANRSAAPGSRAATIGIALGVVSIVVALVAVVCYLWLHAQPVEHHCKDFDTYRRC